MKKKIRIQEATMVSGRSKRVQNLTSEGILRAEKQHILRYINKFGGDSSVFFFQHKRTVCCMSVK